MKFPSTALAAAALCIQQATAATWYYLEWQTPSSAYEFLEFSMQMVVPTLPNAGTYYLWPGLQDTANTGVYQHVLDGRSGTWWIGAGWCCSNPNLSWGNGFNVNPGDVVNISMTKDSSDSNWTSITTYGSQKATNAFPLGGKNFNQAILAIELDGQTWNFGQLAWKDVVMVMNTTQTSWCTNKPINYQSRTTYTMSTPVASTNGGKTTCTISSVVMEKPAS